MDFSARVIYSYAVFIFVPVEKMRLGLVIVFNNSFLVLNIKTYLLSPKNMIGLFSQERF